MGDQTINELCIEAADIIGIQREWTDVMDPYNEGDTSNRVLVKAAASAIKEVAKDHSPNVLRAERSFVTVAGETQPQATWMPEDLDTILPGTMYLQASRIPIEEMSPSVWSAYKTGHIHPTYPMYYRRGRDLLLAAPPDTGSTIVFEYRRKAVGWDNDGNFIKQFTANEDTALFDDETMHWGIRYKYREAKRLSFDVEQANFWSNLRNDLQDLIGNKTYDMTVDDEGGASDLVNRMKSGVIALQTT